MTMFVCVVKQPIQQLAECHVGSEDGPTQAELSCQDIVSDSCFIEHHMWHLHVIVLACTVCLPIVALTWSLSALYDQCNQLHVVGTCCVTLHVKPEKHVAAQPEHRADGHSRGNCIPKQAAGHTAKLGFGSSSHSRIEHKAQHAVSQRQNRHEAVPQGTRHIRCSSSPQQCSMQQNGNGNGTKSCGDIMQPVHGLESQQPSTLHGVQAGSWHVSSQNATDLLGGYQTVQHSQSQADSTSQMNDNQSASGEDQLHLYPLSSVRPSWASHDHPSHLTHLKGLADEAVTTSHGAVGSLQACESSHSTPSFMRPTVSSLVHTASRQRSLRKSQSEVMM